MRTKRALATILWFLTGWMVGAMVAYVVGLPTLLGAASAITVAVFVNADPFHLLWPVRGQSQQPMSAAPGEALRLPD